MYWILFVMGAIAALAIALIVGGLVTARSHVAERAVTLRAPIDRVWAAVRAVDRYAEWRPELESSELLDDDAGVQRWRENSPQGSLTFGIIEDVAPSAFGARLLDEDVALRGEWRWQLSDVAGATRVRLTEYGEIGNPIARFIAAHMTGHTRAIDRYLRNLAAHLGQPEAHVGDGTGR